jgi:hypothetical protein
MNPIALQALRWILPVVLGPIVYKLGRYALNVSDKIDCLPATVKRLAIMAIGTALSTLFTYLHLTLPAECASLVNVSADIMVGATRACAEALNLQVPLQGLTAAAVAMVIHRIKMSHPST